MLRQVQVLIQIMEKGYKTVQEKQTLGIHRIRISLKIIQTISLIQARKLERQITLDIRVEVIHLIVDQDITKIDLQDRVMTPIDPLAQDTKEETLLALDQALDITEVVLLARADLHLAADLLPEVHLREEEAANKIFLKKLKSSC